jgi:hypothetical protein
MSLLQGLSYRQLDLGMSFRQKKLKGGNPSGHSPPSQVQSQCYYGVYNQTEAFCVHCFVFRNAVSAAQQLCQQQKNKPKIGEEW